MKKSIMAAMIGVLGLSLCATAAVTPNGMVILHTDYGADSIYVGILKGVIYTKFADATIDAITNSVPPFDIVSGAYMLLEACAAFPPGTVFCCVVDPGVGGSRKPIALATGAGHIFVGPDNGLLSLVAERYGVEDLRECTNELFWREGERSTTFHGRDVFGPVAASLAAGIPLDQVGPRLDARELTALNIPQSRVEDGAAYGVVIRIDVYGNLITNITRDQLESLGIGEGQGVDVTVGEQRYATDYVRTYSSVPSGDRLVLIQSSGLVELAQNMLNLAEQLGAQRLAPVILRKMPPAER